MDPQVESSKSPFDKMDPQVDPSIIQQNLQGIIFHIDALMSNPDELVIGSTAHHLCGTLRQELDLAAPAPALPADYLDNMHALLDRTFSDFAEVSLANDVEFVDHLDVDTVLHFIRAGHKRNDIANHFGVSRSTLFRFIRHEIGQDLLDSVARTKVSDEELVVLSSSLAFLSATS